MAYQKRDKLSVEFPNLVSEWHSVKNELTPDKVTAGSGQKVWWKCQKCNHEWEAAIENRALRGTGCPVCAGRVVLKGYNDLAALNPELAAEWDYDKNVLNPTEVTAHSCKIVWWICHKCGRSWQATINSRSNGVGCICDEIQRRVRTLMKNALGKKPETGRSLAEKNPTAAKQWHPTKNGDLTPHDQSAKKTCQLS